ncbi:tripartite tricarboxylate transporter TctB family protein [Salinisphaera sp. USBA-960]|uniref:tripartite tricarboxylate transporter TctB family protein n=1 Tax=Salinisphaera orenii TaxID=856731 RepID=UPI000DBE4D20|nr:tripartite tricarboxylate transporter TctB family protein [Salifodinibacter halophilus]NNC26595.1 tripartite tricarboxylate transporter TctB family protein [Salifodinibacter halophilus]
MTARGDRILGIGLFVLAIVYGWTAQQWPEPFGAAEGIGPETFPTLLAVVLALSSGYLIVRPDPDAQWPRGRTAVEILLSIAILVVYSLLLEPLGFVIATTLAVGTLCWLMGARPVPAFLTGLIGAVVVFFLFNNLLALSLPAGLLGMV